MFAGRWDSPHLRRIDHYRRLVKRSASYFYPPLIRRYRSRFRPAESGLAVQVVALKRMLWHERMWCRLPETSSGPFKVAAPNYAALLEGLTDAKTSLATGQRDRFVILD